MNSISLLLTLFPELLNVLRQGQAAYAEWIEARKINATAEVVAKLEYLAQDFVRIGLIAELELAN